MLSLLHVTILSERLKSWTLSRIGAWTSLEEVQLSTSFEQGVKRDSLLHKTSKKLSTFYNDISSTWKMTKAQKKKLQKLGREFASEFRRRERYLRRVTQLDKRLDRIQERMLLLEVGEVEGECAQAPKVNRLGSRAGAKA